MCLQVILWGVVRKSAYGNVLWPEGNSWAKGHLSGKPIRPIES